MCSPIAFLGRVGSQPGSLAFWELLLQWERKGMDNFQKAAWAARIQVILFTALILIKHYFLLL